MYPFRKEPFLKTSLSSIEDSYKMKLRLVYMQTLGFRTEFHEAEGNQTVQMATPYT